MFKLYILVTQERSHLLLLTLLGVLISHQLLTAPFSPCPVSFLFSKLEKQESIWFDFSWDESKEPSSFCLFYVLYFLFRMFGLRFSQFSSSWFSNYLEYLLILSLTVAYIYMMHSDFSFHLPYLPYINAITLWSDIFFLLLF